MEGAATTTERTTSAWGPLLLLLAGAAVLLTFRLDAKDVWEASEGRPLQSAREMRWHGDSLVQYTNGQVDLTKPPLYAWLTALAFRLTGTESAWAGRLPSVLATLGILAVVFVLARRAAGRRAGLLAAFLCLTQARFFWQARLAELETLLALGVLLAYAALPRALDASSAPSRWRWSLAFHAALGFGFAVKGPIALLLVLPGSIAYALAARQGRAMRSAAFVAGVPAFLVVGLAWYVAVVVRDPASLDTFLSYAKGENVGHLRNIFYYLWQWPLNALPWTPLVVLGGLHAWRSVRPLPPAERRPLLLPGLAFLVTFVVQSLLHAKQTHYLVPVVFPMGAVLAGVWLDRAIALQSKALSRATAGTAAGFACLGGAGFAWWFLRSRMTSEAAVTLIAAITGLVCAAIAVAEARRGPRSTRWAVAAWAALVLPLGAGFVAPAFDGKYGSRGFMERVAARVPPGAHLAWTIFGSHSDYLWYLPERLVTVNGIPELVGPDRAETVQRVRAHLDAREPRFAIVFGAEAAALGSVALEIDQETRFQKETRHVVLVANAAGAALAR